jgi:hypothetical protein
MNLNSLTARTSEVLKNIYSLEVLSQIDWHPALERQGIYFQTNVCDSLSDALRISPASIARSLQDGLAAYGYVVETDSRGFIFVEASQFELSEQIRPLESVVLYLQPPTTSSLSLYYCKFLSQVAIQLEMLSKHKIAAKIYIPDIVGAASACSLIEARQFYGKMDLSNF